MIALLDSVDKRCLAVMSNSLSLEEANALLSQMISKVVLDSTGCAGRSRRDGRAFCGIPTEMLNMP